MIRDDLIAFEESIAAEFNAGKIPYPVHLESGNESHLIRIFRKVRKDDWIFVSWRGHLKALLKGVPPGDLRAAIHRGESMALRFPEHRVYGSAIVGGSIPIALGTALSIQRAGRREYVWCFLGDMTAETGIFHECWKYARNFHLPIHFVIEDNGVSVCTPTREVWGNRKTWFKDVEQFRYRSRYPHAGAGQRVQF